MCYEPLTCPNCGAPEPARTRRNGRRRWYLCPECGLTFSTWETPEALVEGQAFQASMFKLLADANGSREQAKRIIRERGREP